jgi:hypothetical protein
MSGALAKEEKKWFTIAFDPTRKLRFATNSFFERMNGWFVVCSEQLHGS